MPPQAPEHPEPDDAPGQRKPRKERHVPRPPVRKPEPEPDEDVDVSSDPDEGQDDAEG